MPASELMPDLKPAIDLYIEAGGKEESTVLAYGVKLPCWAPRLPTDQGHALDYADAPGGRLPGRDQRDSGGPGPRRAPGLVSGKELIAASGGEELLCRLGVSVARRRKSLGRGTPHPDGEFRRRRAAARMLNLDEDQTERPGNRIPPGGRHEVVTAPDCNIRGCMPVSSEDRSAGRLMAQRGCSARGCLGSGRPVQCLSPGRLRPASPRRNLGSEFELVNLSFKPWPACALAHTYIDAMLGLRSEHSLRAEEIERSRSFRE